jgi:hypothetical protein
LIRSARTRIPGEDVRIGGELVVVDDEDAMYLSEGQETMTEIRRPKLKGTSSTRKEGYLTPRGWMTLQSTHDIDSIWTFCGS